MMVPLTRLALSATGTLLLAGQLLTGTARGASDTLPVLSALPEGYTLSYDKNPGTERYSLFHLAVADQFGVIGSTFAASEDPRLKPLTRLDSYWNPAAPGLPPLRVGDGSSSAEFWDQPARMGGIQLGGLQPSAVKSQPQALAVPGQSDFSVESGRLRENFEVRSNDYGPWITSATYRYGLNATTTVDGQIAQVAGQRNFFGVGVFEALGSLGRVSARIAGSQTQDSTGWRARMGYDFTQDRLSIALRSHIQSSGFGAEADTALTEAFRQRTLASARVDLGSLGKISLASATQTYVDESHRDLIALGHAVRFDGGGVLSTAAAYSPGQLGNGALMLSFTYPLDYMATPTHRTDGVLNTALDRSIGDAFGPPAGGAYRPREVSAFRNW